MIRRRRSTQTRGRLGGLAQRHDPAARESLYLITRFGLGQHYQGIRRLIERLEIEGEVHRIDGVHSQDRALRIEQVLDHRCSSGDTVNRVDTVFEVEDHHVGRVRGLGESIGTIGGTEQQRRTEWRPAHAIGLVRTMVERFATATTSPC